MLYEHQMGCLGINILLNLASAVIHDVLVPDENLDIASDIISMCICSAQLVIGQDLWNPIVRGVCWLFQLCSGMVKSHSPWVK